MGVKARANITISRIIDVEAEIRYYLSQSSTLSTPAKPTTYPPPSAWVTTEPEYSNDNSNTLYFVICTVYTNGSFQYSDVSKSSTYEGIRIAQTRIDQNNSSITFWAKEVYKVKEDSSKVREDCYSDTQKALEDYVTDSDYTKNKAETDSKVSSIEASLGNTASKDDLDGYVSNEKYNSEISKYMRFTVNGIEIGSTDNPLKLTLDNEAIKFENNGKVIGRWDGSNFYTGDIVVELNQRAQFGNFAFVPRSDKSLMFLKVHD